jgi:N-methylhydantoinase B
MHWYSILPPIIAIVIVFWRKELLPNSAGDGTHRGGLGQVIELSPTDGYEFHFSAMFDRITHPARGRSGGRDGACGAVYLADGTAFDAKGKQLVPEGQRLILELPGGGGFGDPADRDADAQSNDIAQGYIT